MQTALYSCLLVALFLTAFSAAGQPQVSDSLGGDERKAMFEGYNKSTFAAFLSLQEYSRTGDSVLAGASLLKVAPGYMSFLSGATAENIDSLIYHQYRVPVAARKEYVTLYKRFCTVPHSEMYQRLQGMYQADQEIRQLLDSCTGTRNCRSVRRAMRHLDSLHSEYLSAYVKAKGWPSVENGSVFATILAIHDVWNRKLYRDALKKAVAQGIAPIEAYYIINTRMKEKNFSEVEKLLATREHAEIYIDSFEYRRMPAWDQLRHIKSMTRRLCPLDYYFLAVHDSMEVINDWLDYYFPKEAHEMPLNVIQKVVAENACNDTVWKEKQKWVERYRLWSMHTHTGENRGHKGKKSGLYVYLISQRDGKLKKAIVGTSDTFRLYFDRDRHELSLQQQVRLQTIMLDSLRDADAISVLGYTDKAGQVQANKALSARRAQHIMNYLLANGVPGKTIKECSGKGVVTRKGEEDEYIEDRRVDVIIHRQ
ncbi:MAG: OmpA family protein [Flavipsychrobacter sp.]|nr:OmpA family protein [Flavipsychrobacter sp.]